ncbi:MAG: hypothetical protein IPK83_19135 [Planctomycetes bacterium]|nr:hypothetical protein [Planctomycetota bacterium]
MGVFAGGDHFPILAELREEVAIDSKANPQARQAILDALDRVLMSIGAALQYRIG